MQSGVTEKNVAMKQGINLRNKWAILRLFVLPVLLMGVAVSPARGKDDLRLTDLKVEYAGNPIGLMVKKPQFSWAFHGHLPNIRQQAYQVLVADSPEKLAESEGNIWDSGVVQSAQSVGVLFAGQDLKSQATYYWKVRVWEEHSGRVLESDVAFFGTALLNESDWQADWVGFPFGWVGKVLYFRHVFHCPAEVVSAKVYLAGIGYHELSINGKKAGLNVLDPATSDYSKRVYYTTFDVTDLLVKDNVMLISVAPGWYGIPKLRLQMDLAFADGTTRRITSNDIRRVTTGPTVRSGILDGEYYDARLEHENWLLPTDTIIKGLPNETWGYAPIVEPPGGKMVSQHLQPIQVVEAFHPVAINEVSPGVYVLDAGQNLAGWMSLRVQGKRGDVITMRFAETCYPDGTVNQENLRTAEATDTYVLKGDPMGEAWEPKFTYHGFRYVQVEGYRTKPVLTDFTIKRVRSAVANAGQFTSSNELLNAIWLMVKRTEASNLHSIPTDCPQRDERMGWMNDMTPRIEQAIYNFDMSRFYPKYLDDVADTQDELGRIADTAPYRYGARPADPVSASYLLLALKTYEYYGNRTIISQHYQGMKAWVDYLATRTKDGIVEYSYYGDWAPPAAFGVEGAGYGAISKNTPGDLISTGFLYYCAGIIADMAEITGNEQDVITYRRLAEKTGAAFNKRFWKEELGGYGSNNQSCNSFALFFGLADGERKRRTLESLVKDVVDRGYHLTTGNICTKYLLEVLTENGHIDVAYKIAAQDTYPSWGYMLANGATTLWERWEYATGGSMNSHNHPMMGSVGSWFYKYLLGIVPSAAKPGFEEFVIKPHVPTELDSCSGSYQSVRGEIKSAWNKKPDGRLHVAVSIPGNSTATVYVPATGLSKLTVDGKSYRKHPYAVYEGYEGGYAVFTLPSGNYRFESDWNKAH
ncbi:alpha-L-rhamnosidase [Anseongella ginsenosidimutans]|uniref:alpha-L-rhamnosidase n=2 Tax=Anseongella ginsenosidimutans TaxID=496056 RepID=A0A4R3KX34_9SPHI|nr:alpha-L-rhamnosidase [Anseongella ginsenosidimutans]